jgi:hypothetical protein
MATTRHLITDGGLLQNGGLKTDNQVTKDVGCPPGGNKIVPDNSEQEPRTERTQGWVTKPIPKCGKPVRWHPKGAEIKPEEPAMDPDERLSMIRLVVPNY